MTDLRRSSPAALRNRDPILTVLRAELPPEGLVLELASGTGEHVVHFAAALPRLDFQPSDPSPEARASIAAHAGAAAVANVRPPLALDAADPASWPDAAFAAVLAINLAHISPWAVTLGLLAGAARHLAASAPLLLYGPFLRPDRPLEPSNAAFDADLRACNPEWGVRRLADLDREAALQGLTRTRLVEMPANNLLLIYRRLSAA
jgi:SAM-dependent methyltransferase